MKYLLLISVLFLAACETTVKFTEPDGTEVKMSETAYLALKNTETLAAMGTPTDPCAGLVPAGVGELSASGQEAIGRAMEMCQIRTMVAAAMGTPSTAQGQIAAQNTKAMVAIEQGQAAKAKAGYSFGAIGVGAYFAADVFASAFSAAGANYNVGDVNMSNSGTSTGGAGGEGTSGAGQAGDRNMSLAIGGDNNFQPGDSNTQATAEKSTSVDNPNLYNNTAPASIVNDADANGTDTSLF